MSRLPKPADDFDRRLLADIQKYGWHVIMVEADNTGPAFAYTIGLFHSFQHPEGILFGLPVRVMHQVLNVMGECVRKNSRFEDWMESDEILEGYDVVFRAIDQSQYRDYLGYALWFYEHRPFPVLQCVWPDSEGRYPWHPKSIPELSRQQPILSSDKSWPFHEGKNRAVFTTKPVLRGGHPILLVVHDEDGDWQFLCGTTNSPRDAQVVGLDCIVQRDSTLTDVANLPTGWRAVRQSVDAGWDREPIKRRRKRRQP